MLAKIAKAVVIQILPVAIATYPAIMLIHFMSI